MNHAKSSGTPWTVPVALVVVSLAAWAVWPRCVFRVRVAATESAAVSRLRTISREQTDFQRTHNGSFADRLENLDPKDSADSAYFYSLDGIVRDGDARVIDYRVLANPRIVGKTGTRYFSIDGLGTLRYEVMRPATDASPILQ